MLYYAAGMGGESAAAIQAAKDLAEAQWRHRHAVCWRCAAFAALTKCWRLIRCPTDEVNQAMFDFSRKATPR